MNFNIRIHMCIHNEINIYIYIYIYIYIIYIIVINIGCVINKNHFYWNDSNCPP